MIWNDHSKLEGRHALLSPSGVSWINYETEEPLYKKYVSQYAQTLGTVVHEYAEKRIAYNLKLRKSDQNDVLFYILDHGIPKNVVDMDRIYDNLMNYINDGIGFKMTPEVILYHSDNCFGTADTISFRKNELRIHDLKTGTTPAHMEQLEIYAALFCLEYKTDPNSLEYELRIYQNDEIVISNPTGEVIKPIMEKIKTSSDMIDKFKGVRS